MPKRKRKPRRKTRLEPERSKTVWTLPRMLIVVIVVGGAALILFDLFGGATATVVVPELSANARQGQTLFAATCAQCHGENGSGSDRGPPLIHDTYNPGHHDDRAFYSAASRGVRQHHWRFGNMPAQLTVSRADMTRIIRFIRETQVANGIVFRPHRM